MSEQNNSAAPAQEQPTTEQPNQLTDKLESAEAEIAADSSLTKEEKKEEIAKIRKLKLKVDGKEYDEELPFDLDPAHEEWMKKQLQLGKMGSKRAQEFSTLRSEVEQLIKSLRENPDETLAKQLGIDMDELTTKHMEKKIARSKKTPAEIELEEARAELERIKRESELEKQRKREEEQRKMEENEYQRFNESIDSAFVKNPSVPDTNWTRRAVVDYMITAFNEGMKLTPDQILPLVKADYEEQMKSLFSKSSIDEIEKYLGEDKSKALRKKNSQKAKEILIETKKAEAQGAVQPKKTEEKKDDGKKILVKDFFKF